ncbi:MAG: SWIM zinc finger domain-containing protein [Oscillospiraceae bacterium]|nr:SWIM zinc finger domain-containing protein [Oscillospiraceae bacterium]
MTLNKSEVDLLAQNASAIKNGEDIANKKKFLKLSKTSDETLLFGECAGSGKNPYFVSVDFIDKKSPVFRCSCPSRQIPCKHALGLMYSFINGNTFKVEDIPDDIAQKRERLEKRIEKKQEQKENNEKKEKGPKTFIQKSAQIKKIDMQLQGIEIAGKILESIVNIGIAAVDGRERKTFEDQIKQLGNYYISGIQNSLLDIFLTKDMDKDNYIKTINQITYSYALIKQAKEYLKNKREDPEKNVDLSSSIEEQIGYAWKLSELSQYGMKEENAELVQLGFYSYEDLSRKEFVDVGYWISLHTGKLYKTKNYRPFKAVKYIKEDDSFFNCLETDELFIYPGSVNPRIRWDNFKASPVNKEHIERIKYYMSSNFNELGKSIKNMIRSPLADKNPIALIKISSLKKAKGSPYYIAFDEFGNGITLGDISIFKENLDYSMDGLLDSDKDVCMAVVFENNMDTSLLVARPISIITDTNILRIIY